MQRCTVCARARHAVVGTCVQLFVDVILFCVKLFVALRCTDMQPGAVWCSPIEHLASRTDVHLFALNSSAVQKTSDLKHVVRRPHSAPNDIIYGPQRLTQTRIYFLIIVSVILFNMCTI